MSYENVLLQALSSSKTTPPLQSRNESSCSSRYQSRQETPRSTTQKLILSQHSSVSTPQVGRYNTAERPEEEKHYRGESFGGAQPFSKLVLRAENACEESFDDEPVPSLSKTDSLPNLKTFFNA